MAMTFQMMTSVVETILLAVVETILPAVVESMIPAVVESMIPAVEMILLLEEASLTTGNRHLYQLKIREIVAHAGLSQETLSSLHSTTLIRVIHHPSTNSHSPTQLPAPLVDQLTSMDVTVETP